MKLEARSQPHSARIGETRQSQPAPSVPSDIEHEPSFTGKRCESSNVNVGTRSDSELLGHAFAQFLSHEGLRKFGDEADNAAFGEMDQLHEGGLICA